MDDYICYEGFLYYWLQQYNVIIEEEATGKMMCYFGIIELMCSRRKASKIGSTTIIVHPEFRKKYLLHHLGPYLDTIILGIGFEAILADAFLVNLPMQENQRRKNFIRVGVVPAAGVLQGHGLADGVLSYHQIARPNAQNVTQIPMGKI